MMEMVCSVFEFSCLEPDADDLLWQLVQVFHRQALRSEQDTERNGIQQRTLHDQQDGSEVQSVALEECPETGRVSTGAARLLC